MKLKKKRKKRRPEQIAFDRAWKQFSLYIRSSSNNCITCGLYIPWENRHAGHFKHGCMDFNEKNVHMQCNRCNTFGGKKFGAGRGDVYAVEIIKRYGIKELMKLDKESKIIHKYTLSELKEIEEKYKHKIIKKDLTPY